MSTKFETRQLRVVLTDEERLKLAQDIGRASQSHAQAREQAKEVAAKAKAEVERTRMEVEEIGARGRTNFKANWRFRPEPAGQPAETE
jgi:hypothetical protein